MARLETFSFRAGQAVPGVTLGRLVHNEVRSASLRRIVSGKRVALIGVPGAFTPTCTRTHIPDFVQQAEQLKRVRFDMLLCVAPNDPWTVAAWAEALDPSGRLTFLSDGNMDLARSLGAMRSERSLFLGERPSRYLAVLRDGMVEHLKIEPSLEIVSCTSAQDAVMLG